MGRKKAAPEETVDLKDALSSANFAQKIQVLHDMKAESLMYLKLNDFLGRTNRLLGLETDELGLGYAATAKNAVDRINQPVIASVYHGIGKEQVEGFMGSLVALPAVRKDKDYTIATKALLRASETQARVNNEYPGFQSTWESFFDEELRPVFRGLPNLIHADPERMQLFQALAAIADGTIPMGMEDHREALEYAHEAFTEGRTEDLADGIFALTQKLTHIPPPMPPGPGNPDDDEEHEKQPNQSGGGGSGGKAKKKPEPKEEEEGEQQEEENEGEEDESNEDEDKDEGSEEEGPEEEGPEEEGTEEDEEEPEEEDKGDPFEKLGQYLKQVDEKQEPSPLESKSKFDPKQTPKDINLDEIELLRSTKADIGVPKVSSDLRFLYLETPEPPGGREAYGEQMLAYASEEMQVRRIIDELFRTNTIIERGQRSGRIDNSRLHRVAFDDPGVFRRDEIDSLGHMELIVLIDESGSMTAVDNTTGFKKVRSRVPTTDLDADLIMGRGVAPLNNARFSTARILAGLLVEASRHLQGFHVEVMGYASGIYLNELGPVGREANSLVRQLATTERPYSLVTTTAMGGNADAEAFAYAIEKLAGMTQVPQKGLIYLADGHTYDGEGVFDKLIKKANVQGIAMHFMDLSGSSHYASGPLIKLPRTAVSNPKDMLKGLKQFLHRVVRAANM